MAYTTLTALPAVAGTLAALPLAVEAAKGASALLRLRRASRVRRTDWRWRLRRLAALASALAWLGGAGWTLWRVVTG